MQSIIAKIFDLGQRAYLIINRNFEIREASLVAANFSESPHLVRPGEDVRLSFPELVGYEPIMLDILDGRQDIFDLKGIGKVSPSRESYYIDICMCSDRYLGINKLADNSLEDFFLCLAIENVTESMVYRQQLQQRENEAYLLVNQLELTKDYIEKVVSSMADALLVTTAQGTIKTVNPAAQKLFGYPEQDLVNQSLSLIIGAENLPQLEQFNLSPHNVRSIEVNCLTKAGIKIPIAFSCSTVQISQDELGFVFIGRDITQAKAVERMKDEFISVASHELRTPLTSIRGSLGLLGTGQLGELSPKGQRLLDIAVKNTERLSRLVNDILDLERMKSGKIAMARQTCDGVELVEQAIEVMQAMADKGQVTLQSQITETSIPLWADPDHILQTLTNLLSNAVKFSHQQGIVTLKVETRPQEILFQVQDQGRGIPADKLDKVFESFQQVDASDSREKGGTGLGLAICRQIVQMHGGCIWVESILGEGSNFLFTLPRQK